MVASNRVTIREVARQAGVSPTTVSHALNGRGRVNEQTRALVLQTVRAMRYRANPLARNLRQDRFGAVGLYLPERNLSLQFYIDLALAASRTAFSMDSGLMLLPPTVDPDDILRLPLDGVIIAEPVVDDPVVDGLVASDLPVVFCEAALRPTGENVAVIENRHGIVMRELLDHLVAEGASEIAVVAAHESVWWSRLSYQAADRWARRTGHPIRWSTVPFACSLAEAHDAVAAVLTESVPDALILMHEGLAPAALAAAAERNLSVPDDLLLACTVDSPELELVNPSITAIDLHPSKVGELAAGLLLGTVAGPKARLRPTLRIRSSTRRTTT